jgi:hypothetical protein
MYINRLGGKCSHDEWISVDKNGIPIAPGFRELFKFHIHSKKVWYALACYTGIVLDEPSPTQWKKFYNSATAPDVDVHDIPWLARACRELPPIKIYPSGIREYRFSKKKRAPGKDPYGPSVVESPDSVLDEFQLVTEDGDNNMPFIPDKDDCQMYLEAITDMDQRIGKHIVNYKFSDLAGGYGTGMKHRLYAARSPLRFIKPRLDIPQDMGRISCIQEPGCKARWIANPRRVVQIALKPLGDAIFSLLKELPWDCVHQQSKGVIWAQTQIAAGKTVESVDLSDASNHIPLTLQMRVLHMIGVPALYAEYFRKASRGVWIIPKKIREYTGSTLSELTWTKGQPLGLYPSFAVAFLTHGLMLRTAEIACNKSDTFRVLGDDVVISDDDVALEYRKLLGLLQIPISESKSIRSNMVAEFAGMVITKKTCYVPIKWRPITMQNRIKALRTSRVEHLDIDKKVAHYLAHILKCAPLPLGDGCTTLNFQERAKVILPLLVTQEEAPGVEVERYTHDGVFRKTKAYAEVFDQVIKPGNYHVEKIIGQRSQAVPEIPKPRLDITIRGKWLYSALAERLRMMNVVIPESFARGKRVEREEAFPSSIWQAKSDELYNFWQESVKSSHFTCLYNRLVKGQVLLTKMGPERFRGILAEVVDSFSTEEIPVWSPFYVRGGVETTRRLKIRDL